jgi:2-polyprenyl-6-methoxyphenol hydroxylase-like FAD-dependent oxidoreductase
LARLESSVATRATVGLNFGRATGLARMRIVVVGGAAAGLFSSLLLARAGHEVTVLEQESVEPASDVEAAAESALRASAPQIVHPHIVMSKCRQLLDDHLPDVYQALLAAGVVEVPLATHMPPSLTDRSAQPGDERFTTLATRRSTADWVLQRAVSQEPRVTLRGGCRAVGYLARPGMPPHVLGVRTNQGDIRSDLVVDAAGRRSPVDRWLNDLGARTPALRRAECGLAYYTRHYRAHPGAKLPGPTTSRVLVGLDEFIAGIWGADNGAMQLAVAPLTTDPRFRTLNQPNVHSAVLRTVPALASWLDGLDPITAVYQMAGIHNTLRRLVIDQKPVATGLLAVGDAVCTTNPTLGRGLTLALQGALDLVAALDASEDPAAQVASVDGLVDDHIRPYYEDQVATDEARLAAMRHHIEGAPAPEPLPPAADRITYAQLRTAAVYDPTAFRGLWELQGMIRPPNHVYLDPNIVDATLSTIELHRNDPPMAQPTTDQLLTALSP